MKFCSGAWLPDDEEDAAMVHGGAAYQWHKLAEAMKWVKNKRVAVDIGAHCGLWSMQLNPLFDRVIAFEPLTRHIECLKRNVDGVELHQVALGEKAGLCEIKLIPKLSGRSHIDGEGEIPVMRLDDYDIDHVDLLKVDIEGYELFALKGGEETLLRCKPTIIVEQKKGHASRYGLFDGQAVTYLMELGYQQRNMISGDRIMSWGDTQ